LNRSSELLATIIRVVGTPQMVFTNTIMTTCVNKIVDRPSMSSIDVGGYKNIDAKNPRGGYQEPSIITTKNPHIGVSLCIIPSS